ncbi:MAG: sugar phosphate isomerase/epimerase family protein [Candidatus Sumerlaeaceae bacterium]
MKYGINMLLWTDDATGEEWTPLFEQIKEAGYDGVEIPVFSTDAKSYEALGNRLNTIGLERTAVTVRSEQDDPVALVHEVASRGIEANKSAVECCAALGASHLVGPFHSALGFFSGAPPTTDQRKRAVDSMQKVSEHAAANDIVLALEYLNRFELYLLNCAADMAEFIDSVDHPNCQMMYDTFHAHIEEKNVRDAIMTAGKRIAHVHISENDRSTPGTGQVHWDATFSALREIGYDGWLVVEAFGLALPKLAAATKIWRRMFPSEESLMRESLQFMKRSIERTLNPAAS